MKAQRIIFPAVGRAEIEEFIIDVPKANEVQVACVANGICMFDVSLFTGVEPMTYFPGGRVGHEGIGQVVQVGPDVKHLSIGDWVPTNTYATRENLSAERMRAFVRPPVQPEHWLSEPATCVTIATNSYGIVPGDRVLVLGAGYMGLLNVQMLSRCPLGALVVADVKPGNLEKAKQLGATETILVEGDGEQGFEKFKDNQFDLVVEVAGVQSTLDWATRLTRPGGRLAIFAWHHERRPVDLSSWAMKGLRVLNCGPAIGIDTSYDCFERAQRLLEIGIFDMAPLITHRHHFLDAQAAMELACERPQDYIKGVFFFD
jgi:threonine dehydrogenase-like Zn-dependent dehydrogenase